MYARINIFKLPHTLFCFLFWMPSVYSLRFRKTYRNTSKFLPIRKIFFKTKREVYVKFTTTSSESSQQVNRNMTFATVFVLIIVKKLTFKSMKMIFLRSINNINILTKLVWNISIIAFSKNRNILFEKWY